MRPVNFNWDEERIKNQHGKQDVDTFAVVAYLMCGARYGWTVVF